MPIDITSQFDKIMRKTIYTSSNCKDRNIIKRERDNFINLLRTASSAIIVNANHGVYRDEELELENITKCFQIQEPEWFNNLLTHKNKVTVYSQKTKVIPFILTNPVYCTAEVFFDDQWVYRRTSVSAIYFFKHQSDLKTIQKHSKGLCNISSI